jgi:hypothetical protein
MAKSINDFRIKPLNFSSIDDSGKYIGKNIYWRLYTIENLVRIVVHSVLIVQIHKNWWDTAADESLKKKVIKRKAGYLSVPWHSNPGSHEIYFIDLSDLMEIIRANSHLISPMVKDIDLWVGKLEQVRVPRNVAAHMNWPNATDKQRIDVLHSDVKAWMSHLSAKIAFVVPQ